MAIRSLFLLFCCFSFSGQAWESTISIWNFGLITACDIGVPQNARDYFFSEPVLDPSCYENVQSGDLVWVPPHFLEKFYEKILPNIRVPFVLVVSDGDASFPTDCISEQVLQDMIHNEMILHIFAQNCVYQGPSEKISHIPIGVDFHTVAYKGENGGWGIKGSPPQQESMLFNALRSAPPTAQRKCRAYVDFQHSDTMHGEFKRYLQFGEDRTSIFRKIKNSGVVDFGPWIKRSELWKKKCEYAFSISPPGNGLDCHRTWEDLILGCIVIVKSSPLDPLYEGLPVVIVDDWDEIQEENLKKWLLKFGDASINSAYRNKLTNQFWLDKIFRAATPYRCNE